MFFAEKCFPVPPFQLPPYHTHTTRLQKQTEEILFTTSGVKTADRCYSLPLRLSPDSHLGVEQTVREGRTAGENIVISRPDKPPPEVAADREAALPPGK